MIISRFKAMLMVSGAAVAAVPTAAAAQGAQIIRVHDVAETRQAMNLHLALNASA